MAVGIVTIKNTNHVLAAFTSRGHDPNPDLTSVVGKGLFLRDKKGKASVLLPPDNLVAQAVSDAAPDRVALVLTAPQRFAWVAPTFEALTTPDPTKVVWDETAGTLKVPATATGSAAFLVVIADPAGGAATATAGTVIADGTPRAISGGVISTAGGIMFIEGFLPIGKP